MTHLKKYWIWYLIAIVVVVAILTYSNWETVKGWFTPGAAGRVSGSGAKQSCVKIGDGCSYLGLYVSCAECSKRGISIS